MTSTRTAKGRTRTGVRQPFVAEKARTADAQQVHDLVNAFAGRGEMLPRTMGEVYENLRDFFVVRRGDDVLGCVALHIVWEDLAEVRSLAVREESQAVGLGALMVQACIDEARRLGLKRLFALTFKPAFFEKLGFQRVAKETLPHKIWTECVHCPHFPDCNEVPMAIELTPPGGGKRG